MTKFHVMLKMDQATLTAVMSLGLPIELLSVGIGQGIMIDPGDQIEWSEEVPPEVAKLRQQIDAIENYKSPIGGNELILLSLDKGPKSTYEIGELFTSNGLKRDNVSSYAWKLAKNKLIRRQEDGRWELNRKSRKRK